MSGLSRRARLEAGALRVAVGALAALPPAASSSACGWLCRTIGPILPVSRVADRNLRLAMPALDRAGRRRLVREVWENLGRTVGELPHLGRLRRDTPHGPGWEVDARGAEILREHGAAGGPLILFSAHIGNWEMLPRAAAACGVPFSSVYRAASNPAADAVINTLRQSARGDAPGPVAFPKGAQGARLAVAHLSRGGRLGMLVDQKMNDGIAVTLFGHRAMTAPALAAFALRYDCPVVGGHVERLGPARLRLVVEEPLVVSRTGDRRADMALLTQQVNDVIETWIRRRPGSWLWLHRRWPKDTVQQADFEQEPRV